MIAEATLTSLIVELYLKLKIYNPVKDLHTEQVSNQELSAEQKELVVRFAKISDKLERNAPWKPKCYNRALTIKKLLKKRDIGTTLHIGFRKKDGAFDGHAWLSLNGKVVTGNNGQLKKFKELKPILKTKA